MARRKRAKQRPEPVAPAAAPHDAEIARLRELLALMRDHGLAELEIGPDGQSVRMSKNGPAPLGMPLAMPWGAPSAAWPASAPAPAGAGAGASPSPAPFPPGGGPPGGSQAAAAVAGERFLSPMVGTFYRAPSPESRPFVMEGDVIKADSVLCIIEAMKVMNEIKAEHAGKVVQILVENGESVEYGQPLFVIERG